MAVRNFTMFYVYTFLHMSRIQFDSGYRSYFCISAASGVVDGTRYIMSNTTFRIFVICSGYNAIGTVGGMAKRKR